MSQIRLERDVWLTDCVGVESFVISNNGEIPLARLQALSPIFITAKVSPSVGTSFPLEEKGFYQVNKQVTLLLDLQEAGQPTSVSKPNSLDFRITFHI